MALSNSYHVFRHQCGHLTWVYVYTRIFHGERIPMSEGQVARAAEITSATLQARVRARFDARVGQPEAELDISRIVRESAARARAERRSLFHERHGTKAAVSHHERALRSWASRRARAEARRKHILALRAVGAAPDPFADEIDT